MLHLAPPDSGLYFMVENRVYLPGDLVNISDIGAQPLDDRSNPGSTLVCVTTNVNMACCRRRDNNNIGAIGDWYYPNDDSVNDPGGASGENFTKYVFRHQVRLSSQGAPEGPLGEYRCEIPDESGGNTNARINIINILSGKLVSEVARFQLLLAAVCIRSLSTISHFLSYSVSK